MAATHGGILYYVVKVPKPGSPSPVEQPANATPLLAEHRDSTDSGWDNPFRPDGDLSREADEIVELIKGGKPITPTGQPNGEAVKAVENGNVVAEKAESVSKPPPPAANGKPATNGATEKPAQVELKRETVAPTDASQVEHVNLKKKPKCKCCVIQ